MLICMQQISLGKARCEILVLPNDTNQYGTIFGGTLLALMDQTAFIAARKYAMNDVVTVSVENVVFRAPIKLGEIAEITAFVSYVGRTSVEVCVNIVSDGKKIIEDAYFTFVNVNSGGKPTPVVQPSFQDDGEREAYEKRRMARQNMLECLRKG